MAELTVTPLNVMAQAAWSFRTGAPTWQPAWYSSTEFDPFPAYAHDLADVRAAAEHVAERCPPLWDVHLYVADREETSRCNAHASMHEGGHYEGERWVTETPDGLIVLSGKRTPPHPALTRHLVAHEYGHNISWMINVVRGHDARGDATVTEYAKVRGLGEDVAHHGQGGTWHNSIHEIFACDFRILVCGVEEEFWPHPGIAHPREVDDLPAWWAAALADLAAWKSAPQQQEVAHGGA